ncbi:MAG: S8 family serine peptidase [Candidatus Thermoplasmatota archaeon]
MKKNYAIIIVASLLFTAFSVSVSAEGTIEEAETKEEIGGKELTYVPGEILVGFKEGKDFTNSRKNVSSTVAKHGGTVKSYYEKFDIALVQVRTGREKEFIKNVQQHSNVEYAEPNYIKYMCRTPNDPRWWKQWGPKKIGCPKAWDNTTGDENVVIAVIDSGVDYLHPDLEENCVSGYDFVDDIDISYYESKGFNEDPEEDYTTEDSDPMDVLGHGTHCAGITSAVTDNEEGIAGVGWNCKIMPVRAGFSLLYNGYKVGVFELKDIIQSIEYAADQGAEVISMSFGGEGSQSEEVACEYAWNKGCILVAASGNQYQASISKPAGYDKVMAIGSIDENEERSEWSNYGSGLSVVAPGENIISTIPGGGYEEYSGTSMAAPHVAGVAALAITRFPDMNNQEIRDKIESSADYIGNMKEYGHGLVDATLETETQSMEEKTLKITMDYVKAMDDIDPPPNSKQGEWSYKVFFSDEPLDENPEHVKSQERSNCNMLWGQIPIWNSTDYWDIEDGGHWFTFFKSLGQEVMYVTIQLFEGREISWDIADISYCGNNDNGITDKQTLDGRQYTFCYNFVDNQVTVVDPCEEIVTETENGETYYIATGDTDGSDGEEPWYEPKQDDAEIRFKIEDDYEPPGPVAGSNIDEEAYAGVEYHFNGDANGGEKPYTWEWHMRSPLNDPPTAINGRNISFTYEEDDIGKKYNPSLEVTDALGINWKTYVGLFEVADPPLEITKPLKGVYLSGFRVFPLLSKTVAIGKVEVKVEADFSDKVEFYIDGTLEKTDSVTPFKWTWDEFSFGNYKLRVVATTGNVTTSKSIRVFKFF